MFELELVHLPHGADHGLGEGSLVWETCLRRLVFHHGPGRMDRKVFPAAARFFSGPEAYAFCLEVVCGLHSPVFAETEVFGQFRTWLGQNEISGPLGQILNSVASDAKRLRQNHLQHVGGQSYGSQLRRWLANETQITLIGAGQFAMELLPWLVKDDRDIVLLNRSSRNFSQIRARFPQLKMQVSDLAKLPIRQGALIVCAPLAHSQLEQILQGGGFLCLADLRANSAEHRSNFVARSLSLPELLSDIEAQRGQVSLIRQRVIGEIKSLVHKRLIASTFRPFGWEDLCG